VFSVSVVSHRGALLSSEIVAVREKSYRKESYAATKNL
jgi:hypothetical protein